MLVSTKDNIVETLWLTSNEVCYLYLWINNDGTNNQTKQKTIIVAEYGIWNVIIMYYASHRDDDDDDDDDKDEKND